MRKVIAFLAKTPSFARNSGCGQFNGYLAMIEPEGEEPKIDIEESNIWSPSEITLNVVADIYRLGGIYPLTEIPQEFLTSKLHIYGFDTCHSWNSWEKDTFESVKKDTLEWLDAVEKSLEDLDIGK